MCTNGDYNHQGSPDTDTEKKGRERDGKREKDLEKDKENDKSRGKPRSDSKQKSPKRKPVKEEVGFLNGWNIQNDIWIAVIVWRFSWEQWPCKACVVLAIGRGHHYDSEVVVWKLPNFHLYISLSLHWVCVVFRAAGIRQAASWVKESWRRGGELYWSSWMPPDDHISLYLYLQHAFPSELLTVRGLSGYIALQYLWGVRNWA